MSSSAHSPSPEPSVRPARMRRIGLQLGAAFGGVVVIFAVMLVWTLRALGALDAAEHEVATLDRAKHAAHIAEAQVRELHLWQTRLIISRDRARVPRYRAAVKTALASTARVRAAAGAFAPDEAKRLAALVRALERRFAKRLLARLDAASAGDLVRVNDELSKLAARATRLNAALSAKLNARAARARRSADGLRARTRTAAAGTFGGAVLLAVVLAIFFGRRISRRVAALRAGAERVAAGRLDTRISLGRGEDELSELARSFNRMAADLDEHQRRLLRAQRLASIGQVAAGVAHEINNPLAVILGYARMLARKIDDAKLRETSEVIADETRRAQRIVEDLLELARPQRLDVAPCSLAELVEDAAEHLREAGNLDDVALTTAGDATAPCDRDKMLQVLINVLRNGAEAALAARPGGEDGDGDGGSVSLEVSVSSDDDEARVAVRDHGAGMSDEARARALEPFFTTKSEGTGLGLAVSQAIVDAHGGRIEITAAEPGTVVTVALPRRAPRDGSADQASGSA